MIHHKLLSVNKLNYPFPLSYNRNNINYGLLIMRSVLKFFFAYNANCADKFTDHQSGNGDLDGNLKNMSSQCKLSHYDYFIFSKVEHCFYYFRWLYTFNSRKKCGANSIYVHTWYSLYLMALQKTRILPPICISCTVPVLNQKHLTGDSVC